MVGQHKLTGGRVSVFGKEPRSRGIGIPGPSLGYMPQVSAAVISPLVVIVLVQVNRPPCQFCVYLWSRPFRLPMQCSTSTAALHSLRAMPVCDTAAPCGAAYPDLPRRSAPAGS